MPAGLPGGGDVEASISLVHNVWFSFRLIMVLNGIDTPKSDRATSINKVYRDIRLTKNLFFKSFYFGHEPFGVL